MTKAQYDRIAAQAKEEFPLECCGLLGGTQTKDRLIIQKVYPMVNTDKSSEHFSMEPKEQFAVIKDIRKEGWILAGNYHSHPYTPSRPSEEDKRLAYDPEMIYGIISLQDKEPILNFFRIHSSKEVEKLECIVTQ